MKTIEAILNQDKRHERQGQRERQRDPHGALLLENKLLRAENQELRARVSRYEQLRSYIKGLSGWIAQQSTTSTRGYSGGVLGFPRRRND